MINGHTQNEPGYMKNKFLSGKIIREASPLMSSLHKGKDMFVQLSCTKNEIYSMKGITV
jgi:hypothetical protein